MPAQCRRTQCLYSVQAPLPAFPQAVLARMCAARAPNASGSRAWLARLAPDAADTLAAAACLHYAAGNYAAARDAFQGMADAADMRPDLALGCATCHYRLGNLGAALRLAAGTACYVSIVECWLCRLLRMQLGASLPRATTGWTIGALRSSLQQAQHVVCQCPC